MKPDLYPHFCKWFKNVTSEQPQTTHLQVPGDVITLEEHICLCYICTCGCYTQGRGGMKYFITKRGGTWFCDTCHQPVSEPTKFTKWFMQAKVEQHEATRLRVPGEIISELENICTCPICPCGCYTEARGGKQYFIEKRKGVFVHDYCGEAVE